MIEVKETGLKGCYELQLRIAEDDRGRFIKYFHKDIFEVNGLETQFDEAYYSISRLGVLRGLHFQLPPADHVKLVICVEGMVVDAVVDLRLGSPTFGKHTLVELSAAKGNAIYIPKGFAHGFLVKSDSATLIYNVSTVYSPEHDTGILWNSAGISWHCENPILSDRDRGFVSLEDFRSPFRYE